MSNPIKIFIVDDHPMIMDGLISFLKDLDAFKVVGTAINGLDALEKLKNLEVDVILVDIQMPRMNGIELTEKLRENRSELKIIVLTMFGDAAYIKRMLHLGVEGYVLKDIGKHELGTAISAVYEGGQYYSPEVTKVMMNKLRGVTQKTFDYATDLTEREKEILFLILKQRTNQEIADELFISPRTVEAHKRNMLSKTDSKNVAGLVIFAIDNEIFPDFD